MLYIKIEENMIQILIITKWISNISHRPPIHGYSVWGAYRFLTNSGDPLDMILVADLYHRHIPSKMYLFVWRLPPPL
jgi:hypothetical protein